MVIFRVQLLIYQRVTVGGWDDSWWIPWELKSDQLHLRQLAIQTILRLHRLVIWRKVPSIERGWEILKHGGFFHWKLMEPNGGFSNCNVWLAFKVYQNLWWFLLIPCPVRGLPSFQVIMWNKSIVYWSKHSSKHRSKHPSRKKGLQWHQNQCLVYLYTPQMNRFSRERLSAGFFQ